MDELHSPWSPPRRARTARGIRPTTPTACHTFDHFDDVLVRSSLGGSGNSGPVSPYAPRARPPSSASAGGRESARSPSARSRRTAADSRNPFGLSAPTLALVRSLRISNSKFPLLPLVTANSASAPSTHQPSPHHHSHRNTTCNVIHPYGSYAHNGSSFFSSSAPRRAPGNITIPSGPLASPPASPAKSSSGLPGLERGPSANGRPGSPRGLVASGSESNVYATQMLALTEHLQRLHNKEREGRRTASPAGKAGVATGAGNGAPQGRFSHMGNETYRIMSPLERERENMLHGQISVAAMQQRLQHKFGEEAAAFMLHDLKQVPEHLHVLFYMVILQLRELPSPLPSSLGEAYFAVFLQHFDRTVSAAERRHVSYRTQVAQHHVQTQVQLETMQQKVTELSPRGARPTAQAQLQQMQKNYQQQAVEHQAQLKLYAAQAIAAQELHTQVMRLLCVAVAAQERLSTAQLESMGFEGVLQHLPAWEVLFHVRDGVLVMADPSLEAWLVDKRVAKQFAADPRVGHAVLGHHYRLVAERDVRALDLYGLRYAVLHLLLSDEEVTGGERLLMDAEYMEQVFRRQEEGTLYLTLLRLTHKTEVVSEVLRWLRHNMGALRAFPRAVMALWQAAPSRTLLARLVAAAEGRAAPAGSRHYGASTTGAADHHAGGGGGGGGLGAAEGDAGAGDEAAGAGEGGAGAPHEPRLRPSRPQCKLLNPPPFWPAAITQLPGHNGGVTGLVFDRRNRLLAAATAAGTVLVWDHATARCVGTLNGYSPSVPCVDLHPLGKLLAVGSSTDCAVRVRALDSGSGPLLIFSEPQPDPVVKTLMGPRNAVVRHMSYSPDGHLLAVVYGDGTVTVWDPVKGVRSSTMPVLNRSTAARYASFSPNGQLLALACANGTIRVWHLERLNPLHITVLRAYDNNVPIRCAHFSPSGLLLASLAEGAAEVVLWDVASGNRLQVLQGQAGAAPVRSIAFSPGGLLLATAGDDGDVCIWNASTRGQWFQAACLRGHAFAVNSLAFSPCGLVLATGGNEDVVRLWDMGAILHRSEAQRADNGYGLGAAAVAQQQQQPATIIRGDEAASSGRHPAPGVISCLTHNPSGTQLAAGLADGCVCVWDAVSPRRWVRLTGDHGRPVGRVIYSADGSLLASASDDGCICVWNTNDLDVTAIYLIVSIQADAALGPSDSGAGGSFGRTTTAWQAPVSASPTATRRHGPGAGGWVTLSCSVALSPHGTHLASAHDDGTVLLWELPSGVLAARLHGHSRLAYGLQYSTDGRLLASSSDDGTLCLWDPEAALRAAAEDEPPQPVVTLQHRDHVYAVDFAPHGAPALASISRDGSLATWDLRTGACAASAPHGHGHGTDSKAADAGVRYSPCGLLLATWSSKDGLVRVWHAASCTLLRELSGLELMAWDGLGPGPWAAVLRTDYSPFVVRLPERALLLEAAAIDAGTAPESSPEYVAAVADEAAEGLATAAVGLAPPAQAGPAAQRRQEQLALCRQVTFRPREDPLAPVVPDHQAAPLRPCVRIFSGTRSVPHVTLRGRSLVMADNGSTAFYSVVHDAQQQQQQQQRQDGGSGGGAAAAGGGAAAVAVLTSLPKAGSHPTRHA